MKIKTVFSLAIFLSLLVSVSDPEAAENARQVTVQFATGANSTTLKEIIKGEQSVNYKIRAAAGQHMFVELSSDNGSNYFNIYLPGRSPGDEAMYVAAMGGLRYKGILPVTGEYTVSVFLMRNAARRDEKANYSLELTIKGKAKPEPTPAPQSDSIHWPVKTDASGDLPCSSGEPSFKPSCAFKVKRNPYGATIWAVKPDTKDNLRILYFENDAFSTDDETKMSWKRRGDNWWVGAGEKEFYLIPDAVIWGG